MWDLAPPACRFVHYLGKPLAGVAMHPSGMMLVVAAPDKVRYCVGQCPILRVSRVR